MLNLLRASAAAGVLMVMLMGVGEIIAWIIGWDLLLEYGLVFRRFAVGWSGYVENALSAVG